MSGKVRRNVDLDLQHPDALTVWPAGWLNEENMVGGIRVGDGCLRGAVCMVSFASAQCSKPEQS